MKALTSFLLTGLLAVHVYGQLLPPGSSPNTAAQSLSAIRETLQTGSPLQVALLQYQLASRLQLADSAADIRETCLALAAAPTDDAILTLVWRLQQPGDSDLVPAMCEGLSRLLSARPVAGDAAHASAAQVLTSLASSAKSSPRVTQSAMLALASLRGNGLDLLLEVHKRRGRPVDGFFSCLARTRDLRALGELRFAFAQPDVTTGQKIEIVHAIGQVFTAARLDQISVALQEQASCADLMISVLSDDSSPEQLRTAALRALAQISPQDARCRWFLRQSLVSDSPAVREGALEAIYQQEGATDPETLALVAAVAENDERPDLREVARAVLCKNDVEACRDVQ